jgi:hypothetical protein
MAGLDRANQLEAIAEIAFFAQALFQLARAVTIQIEAASGTVLPLR